MVHYSSRKGIALLLTLMFVIVMSVAVGYTLTKVKNASHILQREKQLYQNSMILEDILHILQNSRQLQNILGNKPIDSLYLFLSTTKNIPFKLQNSKVLLFISSARERFNINELNKANEPFVREYFSKMMVSNNYVNVLKDCMSKNQVKNRYNTYNSVIFDEHPYLFREYIASKKQLSIINNFYLNEYNDDNIKRIDFDKLFSFSGNLNENIDLNYATPEVLMLILNTTRERADEIYTLPKPFHFIKDLKLSADEKVALSKFKTSFFEPYIHIKIEIMRDKERSIISFDYDIKSKQGSNFVFSI